MVITGKLNAIHEHPTSNEVTIYLILRDESGHSWEKSYSYNVTEPITAVQFKAMVKADIINDLKPKTYITELQNLVGKEFDFTI